VFSLQSTFLLKLNAELSHCGMKTLLVKSSIDHRYTLSSISTHNGDSVECFTVEYLCELFRQFDLKQYDCVLIDESQFFTDLKVFLGKVWNEFSTLCVIAAGLDLDSNGNVFGQLLEVKSLADSVVELKAKCEECGMSAEFTQRMVKSDQQCVIGGKELYRPVCRLHWNK